MRKSLVGVVVSLILLSCNNAKKDEVEKTADATTAETTVAGTEKKAALEVLDLSAADGIKQSFEAFTRGDVDAMAAYFADTILYQWSSLDSLRGKQAVVDYYKGRWKVIDSATVSETIVLPIQANESQSKYAPTGKWVLYWGLWHVKYKNGNKINFWMHNVNHFNDAGKVDYIGQYLDRAQILKAAKSM
jgi:hypothetical protein